MNILDGPTLRLFKAALTGVCAAVKGDFLTWFNEKYGVKQGCPSGPRCFITFIHDLPASVCPDSDASREFAVYQLGTIVKALLWADDLVLFSRSELGLQSQLDALFAYAGLNKLNVNVGKTECMYVCTRSQRDMHIFYGPPDARCELKQVNAFKYVGVWFNSSANTATHVAETLVKARRAMFGCMSKVLKLAPNVHMRVKCMMFKAYVLSHLVYCCEVIPYTASQVKSLNAVVIEFARWATGLPKRAKSIAILCEAGLRPLWFDFTQARLNYMLLLASRDPLHPTNIAMGDIINRRYNTSLKRWHKDCMGCFRLAGCNDVYVECLDGFDRGVSIVNKPLRARAKQHIKNAIHTLCMNTWNIADNIKFSYYLNDLSHTEMSYIRCSQMNILNGHSSFIYMYTQRNGWSEGGFWSGNDAVVTIRACYRDALRLF
jgi:hypothetical protein